MAPFPEIARPAPDPELGILNSALEWIDLRGELSVVLALGSVVSLVLVLRYVDRVGRLDFRDRVRLHDVLRVRDNRLEHDLLLPYPILTYPPQAW